MYKVLTLIHNGVEFHKFFGADYESRDTALSVQEALRAVLAEVSPLSRVDFMDPESKGYAETIPAPTHPEAL